MLRLPARARWQHRRRPCPLVGVLRLDEAVAPRLVPPAQPADPRFLALAPGLLRVVAERLAGDALQLLARRLADLLVGVRQAIEHPLDARPAAVLLPPQAPLLGLAAEILLGQEHQRAA